MISVNISQNGADSTTNYIQVEHFPDNSQRLNNVPVLSPTHSTMITFWWQYEKDEELATLIYLSKHYKNEYPGVNQVLLMPYIPNARMDRVYNKSEVFTLKHFAETINWLGFTKVISFDAHSDVSVALIDRLTNKSIVDIVNEMVSIILSSQHSSILVLYNFIVHFTHFLKNKNFFSKEISPSYIISLLSFCSLSSFFVKKSLINFKLSFIFIS